MEFPMQLRMALEKRTEEISNAELLRAARGLSERYRQESGTGKRLLTTDVEAAAYSVARMPATFGAVASALENGLLALPGMPRSLLDVGAGSGAASWAADALLELERITCLEREPSMRQLGQALMEEGTPALRQAQWKEYDITKDGAVDRADLVIASYVLNELSEGERKEAALRLWQATDEALLLVEPGTPASFRQLRELREILLREGAHIAAPCPAESACPIEPGDWCHFTCRLARSRLHRALKSGDVPYEDEKFSYLMLSKEACSPAQARVLRHPRIDTGWVMLRLCTAEGLCSREFRKKDGSLYKQARKAQAGSAVLCDKQIDG